MLLFFILNYFWLLCQAYAWGFDIRSWQRHLNPLTWPEILRQFGLSAGFGPQLKKRNVEQAYLRDDNEVVPFFFGLSFFNAVIVLLQFLTFKVWLSIAGTWMGYDSLDCFLILISC